jgi:hypothetical protein
VVPALVGRLARAADAASRRLGVAVPESGGDDAVNPGSLVPICRVLRNVASAGGDGRGADSILSAGGGVPATTAAGSSLARLIALGALGAGADAGAVAAEAASTAGACLHHAGLLPPPSGRPAASAAARDALLPALLGALASPLSTFDLRREAAWALWSAVDPPPPDPPRGGFGPDDATTGQQVELLAWIVRSSPREVAGALTTMLSAMDSDASEASLRLIDLLFRRLDGGIVGLPTLFEEVGLVDALWRVCDTDTEESFNAEMAAAILDDFYEREDDGDDDADASLPQPSSSGGQFQFQIPERGIPPGGFDFGAGGVAAANPHGGIQLPPSGRGRGRVLPAWMALN